MKTKVFTLLGAALAMVSGAALAADDDSARSAGAHPVVYDDYPESDVVVSVTDDIVLTVTGEARVRYEWVENNSDFSSDGRATAADDDIFDDGYDFAPARMNVGFRVDLPRDVAAVIELQGAWDFGGNDSAATDGRAGVNQGLRPGNLTGLGTPASAFKPGGTGSGFDTSGPSFGQDGARAARDAAYDAVHVYQGYLEMANIGDSIFSLRFGRQELAYGTEFLLGNQDWYDGLSWDGAKGIFQFTDNARLDLFWSKVAENNTSSGSGGLNDDIDLYGAYASIKSLGGSKIGMDAYLIGMSDARDMSWDISTAGKLGGASSGTFAADRTDSFMSAWWVGVRFFRDVPHGLHFSAEVTYLFGDFNSDWTGTGGATDTEMDISAWAMEGFLGYTWDTKTNPTLKFGLTYAQGSDYSDLDNADWNTFFTPAGEIHERLGLMDLIDPQNVIAWTLGYAGSNGNHAWGVDVWHFEQDNTDPFINNELSGAVLTARGGEGFDEELGNELDLWYNYQYSKNMVAQFAIGYFDAGNFIEEVNNCDTDGDGFADDCDANLASAGGIATDDAWRVYANLLVRF